MNISEQNPITVVVSGGFDPLHIGHIRMFQEARRLGDQLVIILNNDNWLRKKKGYVFMDEEERKEIIKALSCVDSVILSAHEEDPTDMSVCKDLEIIRPDIFANGGDRKKENVPEDAICKKINCEMVYGIGGGKIQSSSWLLRGYKLSTEDALDN